MIYLLPYSKSISQPDFCYSRDVAAPPFVKYIVLCSICHRPYYGIRNFHTWIFVFALFAFVYVLVTCLWPDFSVTNIFHVLSMNWLLFRTNHLLCNYIEAALALKSTVLWDITPFGTVEVYLLRAKFCFYLQNQNLMTSKSEAVVEALYSACFPLNVFKYRWTPYQTIRRHILLCKICRYSFLSLLLSHY